MNTDSVLILIALVGAFLALIVGIIALLKALKAYKRTEKRRIKTYAKEEYNQQTMFFIEQKLKGIVHEELLKQQAKKESQAIITGTPVVPDDKKSTESEAEEEKSGENAPAEKLLPAPKTWYTGSYTTGAFRHISLTPDDKTVYYILAGSEDATEGILNIDQNAYAKVAQTPDYLEKACTLSGTGTRVKVVRTGTVIKEGGAWIVKDPIIVEFN